MRGGAGLLISVAKSRGVNRDAGIRQDLARLYTLGELGRFNGLRVKAAKEQGDDIPGMPNVAKLSMSQIVRLTRDLGLRIVGPGGMLHAYDGDDKAALKHATGDPFAGGITEMALFAQAPPIYGGTDQVQTQHHRGAGARAAQGAQQRPRDPLRASCPRTPEPPTAASGWVGWAGGSPE